MVDREETSFEVGGERCAATVFRPGGSGQAPCVVMGTGLACVRKQGIEAFAERLAGAGILALAFDYRNFGESEGEPRQLLDVGGQLRDFNAALAFARSMPEVDPGRTAVWGYSLGGGHAQQIAAADPSLAAAVAVAPYVDGLRNLLYLDGVGHALRLTGAGFRDLGRALTGRDPYFIRPWVGPGADGMATSSDALDFEAVTPPGVSAPNEISARIALRAPFYRPGARVGRIRCPILYCVATEDGVVPPKLAMRAAERAPRSELQTFPGGHFSAFLGETFERVANEQTAFLRRHLGV